ncbi:hypothetical protein [Fusobacterium sp. THCT1E2]
MEAIEKKVQESRENLTRIFNLKKEMIKAEIKIALIKQELRLNNYDLRLLLRGELKERENELQEIINEIPEYIKNRDRAYKKFKIALLEKGLTMEDVVSATNIDINKIYRALRKANATRDVETERVLEKYLGVKVF